MFFSENRPIFQLLKEKERKKIRKGQVARRKAAGISAPPPFPPAGVSVGAPPSPTAPAVPSITTPTITTPTATPLQSRTESPFQREARERRERGEGLEYRTTKDFAKELERKAAVAPPLPEEEPEEIIEAPAAPTALEKRIEEAQRAVYTDTRAARNIQIEKLEKRLLEEKDPIAQASIDAQIKLLREPTELEAIEEAKAAFGVKKTEAEKELAKREEEWATGVGEAPSIARGAVGAEIAARARGRGGAQTSTAAQIIETRKGLAEKFQREAREADPELNRLKGIIRTSLESIEELGKTAVTTKQRQAISAEVERNAALLQVLNDFEATKETARKNTYDFVSGLSPESLANFSEEELTTVFTEAGLSPVFARGLQASAKKMEEAAAKKDEIALRQAEMDYFKDVQSLQSEADKNIRNYQTLAGSLARGEITQEAFDRISSAMGLRPEEIDPLDRQIKQAELNMMKAKTESEQLSYQEQLVSFQDLQALSIDGENILANLATAPVGEIPERAEGQDEQFKGYCSAFVNDTAGTPLRYGSSLQSKERNINVRDVNNPQAGYIFVSNIGNKEIGHCGFIEAVNVENKTATLVDSNRYNDRRVNRRVVPISELVAKEGIIGYENPALSQKTGEQRFSKEVTAQAMAILNSRSGATTAGLSTDDNFRGKVEQKLSQDQQKLMAAGDIKGALLASAGGAKPDSTFVNSFQKAKIVVDQVVNLSKALAKGKNLKETAKTKLKGVDEAGKPYSQFLDLNPLTGWLEQRNPWDTDAQEINAIIQGTIPNLARGIFGEVGVLTDRDIELYRKTLPNLRQTENVQKVVAGLTLRIVRNSIVESLRTQADNGRNVSGNVRYLDELDEKIKGVEDDLGISSEGLSEEDELELAELDDLTDTLMQEVDLVPPFSDLKPVKAEEKKILMTGPKGNWRVSPENVEIMEQNGYKIKK